MSGFLVPKHEMTEEDIKANFITPAIEKSGWKNGKDILYEYSFTDGRIEVHGERATRNKQKFTDYLLYYKKNFPIAVVEAKDNNHSVGAGMQQAINYAEILDVPFAYASNGDGFVEHDRITEKETSIGIDEFPTKEELWQRYINQADVTKEQQLVINEPYYYEMGAKEPRYYQRIAINRTVDAVAKGNNRIMFVMATGTGKTFTAFQIIHRLMKSGLKKRVLFLADRNILVDQTLINDFRPFGNKMTKIDQRLLNTPETLNSYEIYLGLYQQLAGEDGTETHYEKFGPDFFDLIVIDEAHRGSAKEESNWRKILEFFGSATQIGMTATPKEDGVTSNAKYFGNPVYTYSLKQGIEDGFLAPYRVIRVNMDVDVDGYRPEKGKVDAKGELIDDRIYNRKDFDKNLVIEDRTKKVAKYVSDYLKERNSRFEKSIFFCIDIDHAERMRQALVNENSDLTRVDSRYVMRITGDNAEGKAQLDNFIDPESRYPTLVTTSKLLTTGVDAKTCKIIVLDANIGSMTEFKQIIGRGTRLDPERGKEFFTIIDFRGVTNLFADPDFDGEPVDIDIVDPEPSGPTPTNPEPNPTPPESGSAPEPPEPFTKYYVNDKEVKIVNDQVQVIDANGKLVTESLTDYTRKNMLGEYATLDEFINAWSNSAKKQVIIDELESKGVFLSEIRRKDHISITEIDDFDLLLQLAYGQKPLTKAERIKNVKKQGYLYKYSDEAREVLEVLLDKYMNSGIKDVENISILRLSEFDKFGGMHNIIFKKFGGKENYTNAVRGLENAIYAAA
ncbi:MAG: DEAD/DEAH box helicase family protein [Streptococcaceae bacterium]|jgi:type I restriction enzyme R subunit|nr:DEAD/DEAH box helicase family protein [Streptococcaceae bacterium]